MGVCVDYLAVDDTDQRVGLHALHQIEQRAWRGAGIAVQAEDDLTSRDPQSDVAPGYYANVLRQAEGPHGGKSGGQGLQGSVCRTVIDNDDFDLRISLVIDGAHRLQDVVPAVPCHDQYGD